MNTRGGHIGEINEKWDNGFYTKAELLNFNFEIGFLIDSGSTVSIISKAIFDMIMPKHSLEPLTINISDVSGKRLTAYGSLCLPIKLGRSVYPQASLSVIFVKMEY